MGARGPKLTKTERAAVRARIVRLNLQGYDQAEVARRVGLTRSMVSKVLTAARAAYKARATRDTEIEVEQKLDELRLLKIELYEAWERSKSEKQVSEQQKTEAGVGKDGKSTEVRKTKLKKELRDGNVSYAKALLDVIRDESELLGLRKRRVEHTGPKGGAIKLSVEDERKQLVGQMLEKLLASGMTDSAARESLRAMGVEEEDLAAL